MRMVWSSAGNGRSLDRQSYKSDYWIFEQQLCLDRRKNKGAKVIWCNSMERDIFTACINVSRPKLPPALKDSTAHLATAEIRLAFGLDCVCILCAGHLLWNTLNWCDHQLKMSSSVRVRKPRLLPAFCLCNSVVSGVSVCMSFSMLQWRSLSIRAFLKVIWQSLATCFLPESSGSECACLALSVISNHFNLRWGYRLWNPPQAIFVKARWWKVREADYNAWNETQRNKCTLNFYCAFMKPGELTS